MGIVIWEVEGGEKSLAGPGLDRPSPWSFCMRDKKESCAREDLWRSTVLGGPGPTRDPTALPEDSRGGEHGA